MFPGKYLAGGLQSGRTVNLTGAQYKLEGKSCHGAPDGTIEIVLSGSRTIDYYTKLLRHRAAAVREYWIVDPMKESVLHIFYGS